MSSQQSTGLQYTSLTQQELRNLYHTRGTIFFLDVPQGLEFGIDNISWVIGQKFRGVKFVPFGAHIVSYSLKDQNNMFKINKFIYLDQSKGSQTQILVFKWSPKYQVFLQLKGAQAEGYRQGVKNFHFDSYLGPYPSSNYEFWKENTSFITREVLAKLDPIEKIYKFEEEYAKVKEIKNQEDVRIDVDENSDDDKEQDIGEKSDQEEIEGKNPPKQEFDEQSNQKPRKQTIQASKKFQPLCDTIYYSQIPRILTNEPSHINKINLNKTQVLMQVVLKQWMKKSQNPANNHNQKQFSGMNGILGQVQYSFIYFLIGQDEQSFNQWKKLVNLIVFSEDLFQSKQMTKLKAEQLSKGNKYRHKIIQNFQQISLDFIVVLYNQLKQFPADFFIDQLSKNSFMQNCLKRLNQYKEQTQGIISKKVKKRLQKLFKLLQNKFNYVLKNDNEDNDEDAPMIVGQSENYF